MQDADILRALQAIVVDSRLSELERVVVMTRILYPDLGRSGLSRTLGVGRKTVQRAVQAAAALGHDIVREVVARRRTLFAGALEN